MKKFLAALLSITAILSAAAVQYTFEVNSKNANLNKQKIMQINNLTMGMNAPKNVDSAPTTIENSTYGPTETSRIFFKDLESATIKNNSIGIPGKPNPLKSHSTLDEARKAVGFQFATPSFLPDGYEMKNIIVISNKLAEIFYVKGNNTILYRTAKGNDDISGDYNVYDNVKTIAVGNTQITVKGSKDNISLATWLTDDISFSLSFDESVNEKVLSTIIESIK